MNNDFIKGSALALVSALGWSMTGIFVKLLPGFSPWYIVSVRCLVALIGVIIFLFYRSSVSLIDFKNREHWVLGFLMVGYYLAAVSAYQLTTVADVALLLNTSPAMAILLYVVSGKSVQRSEWIGVSIAFTGVGIMVLPDLLNGVMQQERLAGAGLALLSSFFITLYAFRLQSRTENRHLISHECITLLTYALGAMLIVTVPFFSQEITDSEATSWATLLTFILLGLFSTLIPSVTYGLAAQRLSVVALTTSRLIIPLFAAFFAYFMLNEMPSVWVFPGAALIFSGIVIVLLKKI